MTARSRWVIGGSAIVLVIVAVAFLGPRGAGIRCKLVDTSRECYRSCCIRLPRKSRGGFGNHASRGGCGWHPEGRLRERRSVCKERDLTWRDRL